MFVHDACSLWPLRPKQTSTENEIHGYPRIIEPARRVGVASWSPGNTGEKVPVMSMEYANGNASGSSSSRSPNHVAIRGKRTRDQNEFDLSEQDQKVMRVYHDNFQQT